MRQQLAVLPLLSPSVGLNYDRTTKMWIFKNISDFSVKSVSRGFAPRSTSGIRFKTACQLI